MQLCRTGPHREDSIPDLSESSNNNTMVARRVQLQETVQELPEIVFRVYLILQYHLQHRMPEIQIRVVGVFLNGHALASNPSKAFDGLRALGMIGVDIRKLIRVDVRRECGGGRVGGGRGGGRVFLVP